MRHIVLLVSLSLFLTLSLIFSSERARSSSNLPVVSVLNVHDQSRVKGTDLVLKLRVSPSPSVGHPDHFHIFVNGRMVAMFTMTHALGTVHLHHLPKGKDSVAILAADPKTHRLMDGNAAQGMQGMGDMGGMDMGNNNEMDMSGMGNTPGKDGPGTRFVVVVQ
ncbi:MAG: hypothetical protein ACYCYP_05650 [Leptospirales bacterium]